MRSLRKSLLVVQRRGFWKGCANNRFESDAVTDQHLSFSFLARAAQPKRYVSVRAK